MPVRVSALFWGVLPGQTSFFHVLSVQASELQRFAKAIPNFSFVTKGVGSFGFRFEDFKGSRRVLCRSVFLRVQALVSW